MFSRFLVAALAADAECELHVLWHDCDALCVDCAQVCVLEEGDEVCFGGLVEGEEGGGLEAKVVAVGGFEVGGDLADEALEGALLDQELGGLLVAAAQSGKRFIFFKEGGRAEVVCVCGFFLPDHAERDGAWAEAVAGILAVALALGCGGACFAARGLVGSGHVCVVF